MNRFTRRQFYGNQYDPTIGVEFGSRTVDVDDLKIKLQIWDTVLIVIYFRQDRNHLDL